MRRWSWSIEFVLRDMWVGLFWDRDVDEVGDLDVYVCLFPMIVIHGRRRRTCKVCGCTWREACFPTCWWVDVDLCSRCVS